MDLAVSRILAKNSISPPTGRFLMVKEPSPDDVPTNRIIVVQNWLDEIAGKIAAE